MTSLAYLLSFSHIFVKFFPTTLYTVLLQSKIPCKCERLCLQYGYPYSYPPT